MFREIVDVLTVRGCHTRFDDHDNGNYITHYLWHLTISKMISLGIDEEYLTRQIVLRNAGSYVKIVNTLQAAIASTILTKSFFPLKKPIPGMCVLIWMHFSW